MFVSKIDLNSVLQFTKSCNVVSFV